MRIRGRPDKGKTDMEQMERVSQEVMEEKKTLLEGNPGETYVIRAIDTDDEDMNSFLFRLGCYSGEPVTLLNKQKKSCIIVIKDSRYSIDNLLAESILI